MKKPRQVLLEEAANRPAEDEASSDDDWLPEHQPAGGRQVTKIVVKVIRTAPTELPRNGAVGVWLLRGCVASAACSWHPKKHLPGLSQTVCDACSPCWCRCSRHRAAGGAA